jgi:hypothetical protein
MNARHRPRIWILALLACSAIALFVASRMTGRTDSSTAQNAGMRAPQHGPRTILQCVEDVSAEFKIPRNAMKIQRQQQGSSGVQEVRLKVDPGFSSYEFHSALAAALADLDATIVGTESTKTKSISLQIMKDGTNVMLVNLDLRQSPQQIRKESSH